MKIFLAADHAGYKLKEKVKSNLTKKGYYVEDFGTHSDKSTDYPDFVIPACEKVAKTKDSRGIVIGGSGQGEVIAANKVKGIRAVIFYSKIPWAVKLSREHNNSNVLSLGSRFLTTKQAIDIIDIWLKAPFPKDKRHVRRLKKIEKYENKK
jgi:ribose 5-phosphate isomerase B